MLQILGIVIVATAATAGDFIWYTYGVRHTMVAGLVHGMLLLTSVGAVLGAASGHVLKGLPIGTLAGLGGALSYYVLIAVMDSRTYGAAIPGAWVIMWLLLATLEGRWLRAPQQRSWKEVATRGAIAAVLSGVVFALVMNVLWGRPPAGGRNYLLQFVAWACAWAPGLLSLSGGRSVSTGAHGSISPEELRSRIERGETLHILDMRSEYEFASGHVPGARNIPFNQVQKRLDELPGAPNTELIVYCGHGPRAYMAASAIKDRRIVYLSGHFSGWQNAGMPVDRKQ